jgi:pyruvate-ferredoxin/flavodoxin oxidoreductase
MQIAQEQVNLRWKTYENMASWRAESFNPVV